MSPLDVLLAGRPAYLRGLLITIAVWGISLGIGTSVGLIAGWGRFWLRSRLPKWSVFITEGVPLLFQAIPLVILLVWFHYLLPSIVGYAVPPFWTAVIVFTLYIAFAVSDIFSNALRNIPKGEIEAGFALGLDEATVARRVALPLGLRSSFPNLCFLGVDVLKLISLASLIALDELLHVTDTVIAHTYVALPSYTALALLFLVMILPLQIGARRVAKNYSIIR